MARGVPQGTMLGFGIFPRMTPGRRDAKDKCFTSYRLHILFSQTNGSIRGHIGRYQETETIAKNATECPSCCWKKSPAFYDCCFSDHLVKVAGICETFFHNNNENWTKVAERSKVWVQYSGTTSSATHHPNLYLPSSSFLWTLKVRLRNWVIEQM